MKVLLRKGLCAALLLALLAWLACPALAAVGVEVNASSVRIYRSRSTSSASYQVPKGLAMTLLGISGSWAKVSHDGRTGYVQLEYLDTLEATVAYAKKNTYFYKSASADAARVRVKANTPLYVIGRNGDFSRVRTSNGTVGYVRTTSLSRSQLKKVTDWKQRVVQMGWFDGGGDVLREGATGYLYDIDTGVALRIQRTGGSSHAEVEPVTRADTLKLLEISGGRFSWDSHACVLYAGGRYVACAISTKPHGSQTIDSNGYKGKFCLYMAGSRTNESERENGAHEAAIERVCSWARE